MYIVTYVYVYMYICICIYVHMYMYICIIEFATPHFKCIEEKGQSNLGIKVLYKMYGV